MSDDTQLVSLKDSDDEKAPTSTKDPLSSSFDSSKKNESVNGQKHFTFRAVGVGLFVGALLCFSNMYFGLQTGWITMGSLQSSLLGFGIFKLLRIQSFGPVENVLLQTTAVATATMPLAGGFVSVIPAMGMMDYNDHVNGPVTLEWWKLFLFSFGMAFFGVFIAVPLREQTILREKLKFPSGTATAHMIKVLHKQEDEKDPTGSELEILLDSNLNRMKKKWLILGLTFTASSLYIVVGYFVPAIKNLVIMNWFGVPEATAFSWFLTPSLSYVGQGMIMGTRTGVSMFFGAIFGWAFLAPMAKYLAWAPGKISSYQNGAQGWIMWVSLTIMIAESLSSLSLLMYKAVSKFVRKRLNSYKRLEGLEEEDDDDPAPPEQQVPWPWWTIGLVISMIVAFLVSWLLFMDHIPFYQPLVGVILSLFVAILAVRALGETDVNPVSGVGKLTQLAFAVIAPGNILSNLVAGALAEAGAMQAGDMMQDLKTGHLVGASPRAQFFAQLIGAFFSTFFALGAYYLYKTAFEVPSETFPVPTAPIWLGMARLVNGGELAPNVVWFCVATGIIAALLPILNHNFPRFSRFLPSGVAFAVAMYVTPNWTIPRVVGAVAHYAWSKYSPRTHKEYMIIVASGFVLGEGIMSIVTAVLKTTGVPPISCAGCIIACDCR